MFAIAGPYTLRLPQQRQPVDPDSIIARVDKLTEALADASQNVSGANRMATQPQLG